jgi:hypothetical protein
MNKENYHKYVFDEQNRSFMAEIKHSNWTNILNQNLYNTDNEGAGET